MKVSKGQYGYHSYLRKINTIKTVIFFAVSIALFVAGYMQTGTRNNVLTVVAILGCLPASKSAVNMIMAFRAKGCSKEAAEVIKPYGENVCLLYDCYMTSEKKSFDLSCVAVAKEYIYGYTECEKTDTEAAGKHIQDILKMNKMPVIPVKILTDREVFAERLRDMENNVEEDRKETEDLVRLLKAISL